MSGLNGKHFFCNAQAISARAVTNYCSRLRTQDPVKRWGMQTVPLKGAKTVSAEPLAVRTHPQEDGLGTGSKSGTP